MGISFPMCELCRHYQREKGTCTAFPGGVPGEIYHGDVDHRLPYDGDQGIRFELSEEAKTGPLSLWADLPPVADRRPDKALPFDTVQAQPEERLPIRAVEVPVGVEPPPTRQQ
jgi:hypothetical protein